MKILPIFLKMLYRPVVCNKEFEMFSCFRMFYIIQYTKLITLLLDIIQTTNNNVFCFLKITVFFR